MGFRGLVVTACVLLTVTIVRSDNWLWSTEESRSSGSARSLHATATPVIPLPKVTQPSKSTNNQSQEGKDTQPRIFGLNEMLCSLGFGINCMKPHDVRPNSIPGSHYPSESSQSFPHIHTHDHHGSESSDIPSNGPYPPHPGHHHIPEPHHRPHAPGYHEECTCVHSSYCAIYDVVARSAPGDISSLIGARTRVSSDITSNSTAADGRKVSRANETANGSRSSRDKVRGSAEVKEETRTRREASAAIEDSFDPSIYIKGRRLTYTPGVTGCGAAYVCCRNPQLHQPQHLPSCGRRHTQGIVGRIKNPQYVDGNTEFGEYPWHVAILRSNEEYVCGGALIDDRHILTAAHCVSSENPNYLKIRLGDWDALGAYEFYSHIEIPVSFLAVHPQYYAGNLQNDIAVIRIQSHVDFTSSPHISPVCLPDKNYNYFVGQQCMASGWGKDAFGNSGQFQAILQEVELPIVQHHQCEAVLRHTRLGNHFKLHEGMLCAGGEARKDTCEGDGGGPLVCTGVDGRIQLAGLVSWGIGCGEDGLPAVYVNVAHYLQWIQRITKAP